MRSICDNCDYNMCSECGIDFEIPELDEFDEIIIEFDEINFEIVEEDDDTPIL